MPEIASSPTPVGSFVFSSFALLLVSLAVLLILRHYLPLRTTPAFYIVPIFFALWLPSILVLLVPIDLASSAITDDVASRGIWLPQRVVLVLWRITYWLTFCLTWFILPILAEYSDTGYREPYDKFMYSLRANAQFYAMILGAGIIGLVYIFASYEFSFEALKALIMALSYCWGLILAIYLMGHGLVAIPRHLLRSGSISGRLRRLQIQAPRVYEKMEDSLTGVEEVEQQVSELGRRKTGSAAAFQDWIEELQEIANIPESQPRSGLLDSTAPAQAVPHVITEKYLADLTRKLVRARHSRSQYVGEWNRLVQEAANLQTILDSVASQKLDFGNVSPHAEFWDRVKILTPYSRFVCYYYVLPYTRMAFGGLLALASACIVWSEIVKFAFPKLSIIRVSVIHHWVGDKAQVGFAGQVISAFWICYMCAAALSSMTGIKVWRGRALVRRNTGHEAAFWFAGQVAKLSVPLSYNFLTFLSAEVYQKTIFYNFLGQYVDVTPLGKWFDNLFPIALVVPVLAATFGLYGKVKRIFTGVDIIEDEEDNPTGYGTGNWREGRDLIARELGGSTQRRSGAAANGASSRAAPILSIPAIQDSAATPSRSPLRSPVSNNRRLGQTQPRFTDEPPEDDNIFTIIGHRMKNTVDSFETPQWFSDLGQGIKKPKWMGGNDDQPANAGSGSNNTDSGTDIRRWFGGGGGDSHIRI
ncbi:putative lysosomal cobalamin transporter [Trichoderma simmonsii]|uniref:Lysosomal cobalamin transporter n=1 Tax=Trichoderma simmonsii TaxID=1491479 RepID=A0A8G0PH17_9HYPO|nr:putative lysosomal cobalamin transporter [Trichoderma simmonsii]